MMTLSTCRVLVLIATKVRPQSVAEFRPAQITVADRTSDLSYIGGGRLGQEKIPAESLEFDLTTVLKGLRISGIDDAKLRPGQN
jgi:hypothetical protein